MVSRNALGDFFLSESSKCVRNFFSTLEDSPKEPDSQTLNHDTLLGQDSSSFDVEILPMLFFLRQRILRNSVRRTQAFALSRLNI